MAMIVGLFFTVFITQMSAQPVSENAEVAVVKSNSLFSKNMYKELAAQEGNIFFSPISAHAVLSMIYQGASGETRNTFAKVLNIPDEIAAAEDYHQVMSRLNSVDNVTLLIGNKVYLKENYELQDNFNKAVTEKFHSEIQKVNFGDNSKTANIINHWVEEKTQNKIKDLIKSDTLNAYTRLVLVNAIYFKGNWAKKFNKEDTSKQPFYVNENDHIEVDMMTQFGKFNFKDDHELGAKILELPYINEDLSLVVVLPHERTGIRSLEQKLQNIDLGKITDDLQPICLDVHLPKFKIKTKIDLKDVLTRMGLGIIFDEGKADFSKLISGGEKLVVSEVIQKAFIEVNEEGAEAAAASAPLLVPISSRLVIEPISFKADHPFYITLLERKSNVLFSGRVVKL